MTMVEVEVIDGDLDRAIRFFKKKVQADGIFGKLREREKDWKPSCRRKLKQAVARKRKQRRERRQLSLR